MDSSIPDVFLPIKDYIIKLEDFDLIKIIGRGSYGEVYYAIHKTTGTKAALKKLLFEELDEVQLEYFIREVLILAYYQNFFLVSFLGFSPTYPYLIVTEFIPCGSLFDALRRKPGSPCLDNTDKTKIAIGIIEGMICLHSNKVIHRDLKSLNILLDSNKLPKICDFGISRAIDEDNQAKMTLRIGTFHWMAPEMLDSDNYNYKVDIYAFGIMLWEMLTGKVPYQGQDPLKILLNVKNLGMRPIIPPECNEGLSKLITRCWDQDPDVRPTFTELYEIFRDEQIHFNDANIDEVQKFFEQFPVSEDILHPASDNAETNTEIKNEIILNNNNNDIDVKNNDTGIGNVFDNDIEDNINDAFITPNDSTPNDKLTDLDFSYSEEESASISDFNSNHSSEQFSSRHRSRSEFVFQLSDASLKNDSSDNDITKEKRKDKKKDKVSKKDEKVKKEKLKDDKKKEKKKRKADIYEDNPSQLKIRRMTFQEKAFRKKQKNSNPQFNIKSKQQEKNLNNKNLQKNKNYTFDTFYDMEIAEIGELTKDSIISDNNPNYNINKIQIHHHPIKLSGNIFSDFILTPNLNKAKTRLPYVIPLPDFTQSKEIIYTTEKNNIFLQNAKDMADGTLKDTESFEIDDEAFKNFANTLIISQSLGKRHSAKGNVNVPILKAPQYDEANEEESKSEDKSENVELMLRQSSGRGKIIDIFKAEIEEITLEDATDVFNDMKNIIMQRKKKENDKNNGKNEIYIYLLSNKVKEQTELINKFNDVNGFEILPITGNPIITPSFIILFTACILSDIERFPFEVFKQVYILDATHNSKKFLLMLQALLSILIDDKEPTTLLLNQQKKEMITKILNLFFQNQNDFFEFIEFPNLLFKIYTKEVLCNDDFFIPIRNQLINLAAILIYSSSNLDIIKLSYAILLSKQTNSILLFEQTKSFKLPLRTCVNHISSVSTISNDTVWNKGELTFESVSLFGRFENPPLSSTLVSHLIEHALWNIDVSTTANLHCSKVSKIASLILCRLAKTKEGSILLIENNMWMGLAVKTTNDTMLELNGILKSKKNGNENEDFSDQLENIHLIVSLISERINLVFRILMTLFISHVDLSKELSNLPLFWVFLETSIRLTTVQSFYSYNSSDNSPYSFIPLVSTLKAVASVIRRIPACFISSELINNSKLLKNLCSKVVSIRIAEKSSESTEIGLQIIDILSRATACIESISNSSSELDYILEFVARIPSLLAFGGIIAHKTIVVAISVILLHKKEANDALKRTSRLKSNHRVFSNFNSGSDSKKTDIIDDNSNAKIKIQEILPKVSLINEFEKYRKTLLDLLAKKE